MYAKQSYLDLLSCLIFGQEILYCMTDIVFNIFKHWTEFVGYL